MCCIKWRKTYRKTVSLSEDALEYLAQTSWNKGIWALVTITAGTAAPGVGYAALWSVPIHGGLTNSDWKIVPFHQDYSDGGLRLEIKVTDGLAQFRLVNKLSGVTLTWVNFTLIVMSQDDPIIQEMTGTGNSTVSLYYLPASDGADFDPAEIESRLDALEAQDETLAALIASEIARLEAIIESERQARLAMLSMISAMQGDIANIMAGSVGYWEPVTNGDVVTPEIIFSDGDVVMAFVPL